MQVVEEILVQDSAKASGAAALRSALQAVGIRAGFCDAVAEKFRSVSILRVCMYVCVCVFVGYI